MTKHIILFLAANPNGTTSLALDREARAIQQELERSGYRDYFEFETRWAAEPLDLLRELRRLRPTVVHYSGHGGKDGLYFQATDGSARLVSPVALEETFGAAGKSVKVAVLNACYTDSQADALSAHVDCVVGMRNAISDIAARSFALGFYGGLGECESVETAYKQGIAAISLEGLSDGDRPQLKVRIGVDAAKLVLAPHAHTIARAVDESSILYHFARMDSDLQDVFALAAAQAHRDNKLRISTHHIFAAFVRLQPGHLSQLIRSVQQISHDALPKPIELSTKANKELLREPFPVSSCIQRSVHKLVPKTTPQRKLAGEDVFVDIARYGTGRSVRRLRTHGVSRESIGTMVKEFGWQILE
jgi:CHAT domain-containing protein